MPGRFLGVRLAIIVLLFGLLAPATLVVTPASAQDAEVVPGTTLRITKRSCAGRDYLPVFVESHCTTVPDAAFELTSPNSSIRATLASGDAYTPIASMFGGSSLWEVRDVSPTPATSGVRVVSCLASYPGSGWNSAVTQVIQPEEASRVLISWSFEGSGTERGAYYPSVECVWLELPNIWAVPSVLSLQVFTSEAAYLNVADAGNGARLPARPRGASGDDLEANLEMVNAATGEVYTFAADDYGQVLVPAGTYSLTETSSGVVTYIPMTGGTTFLAEIGLVTTGAPMSNAPASSSVPDTKQFVTGIFLCTPGQSICDPAAGVRINYASIDGQISGSCVTEIGIGEGGGYWSLCSFSYINGIPTVFTLDESTLPAGWVLTTENPQTYLMPLTIDGILSPVMFTAEPAS